MSHHRLTRAGQGTPGMRLGAYELVAPLSERGDRSVWIGRPTHAPAQFVMVRFDVAASCTGSERLPYHPHFVRERARGHADGITTTVSEWVEGETLSNLFRQAHRKGWSLKAPALLPPLVQVLDALLVLQAESGLASVGVPRPQHILIDVDGEARVADGSWRRNVDRRNPAKDLVGWGRLVNALLLAPAPPQLTREGAEATRMGSGDALQCGVLQVVRRCRNDSSTPYASLRELRVDLVDLLRWVEPESGVIRRKQELNAPHSRLAWDSARAS